MERLITIQELTEKGFPQSEAEDFCHYFDELIHKNDKESVWQSICQQLSQYSFGVNLFVFKKLFPDWPDNLLAGPVWTPSPNQISRTHIAEAMQAFNLTNLRAFQSWSFLHYEAFWKYVIDKLQIIFKESYHQIVDLTKGVEEPQWLPGAKLNIADSCFLAPSSKTAILYWEDNTIQRMTYGELNDLSNQVANSLLALNYQPGDAIAIDMPMNYFAVAVYLGIIKMGGVVVSIADSFSPEEIAVRLKLSHAKAIFTQDVITRSKKQLPLYEKVKKASSLPVIVITTKKTFSLQSSDIQWKDFLVNNNKFISYACEPMTNCNILFSSGTTGEPKVIPWKHSTPIKVASDAYFHQDIHPEDRLAWPTNLGWMMGPWLIFAALLNQATIALYDDVPRDRAFGKFIEQAKVTMLGVVPTLVATWRQTHCMEGLDWSHIKLFTSTGECSNPEDMFYLMWLAQYKPIIEYCGGTEIGGAYITSTLLEKNYPSVCTTPAFGSQFMFLAEIKTQCIAIKSLFFC